MDFKIHIRIGSIASAAVTVAYGFIASDFKLPLTTDPDEAALVFILCLAGSLAPDLDTQSKISKIASFALSAFCVFSIITREPYLALLFSAGFLFVKSFNHRTWTHVYTLPLVLSLIALKTGFWQLYPLSLGILTHYFVDCLGPQKMLPWRLSNWIKPIKIL